MRFIADGPSIPDELLLARDQGRVIFFCGAGVSRARANLPDFFGLAKRVLITLGVSPDNAAHKLIREAQEIDERVGVSGVISADRVFGLLERDFATRDIEMAVASALKPEEGCDLSAHRILLDLAASREGALRLVTTNFDRLFDDCERGLKTWQPPRLPDPNRPGDMNGIVYLHGRATPKYDGAEGDGFVLSSSEFGRAYLSDGWATSFIREVIGRYMVVFVGYAADDPPVQYLLEALNKTSGKLDGVYAFQSGKPDEAAARWRHKGVESIAYDGANAHTALWQTLEAWADRAKDPDRWYSRVVQSSRAGPEALAPHERGQVAHIISTLEGVREFSHGDEPPPAEWLCVFDLNCRYAKPGYLGDYRERGPYVDPFDCYGLDSDAPPSKIEPDDHYAKREVPRGVWDGLSLNRLDRSALREVNLPAFRGSLAAGFPNLPPRLDRLGSWIGRVANQPAAIWWAARQGGLHTSIQNEIHWMLEKVEQISHPEVRRSWHLLLEAWQEPNNVHRDKFYQLKALIDIEGWDSATVRRYAEARRPRFEVFPSSRGGPKPPKMGSKFSMQDLLRVDVKYPDVREDIQIPDRWLFSVVKALRENLELAVALEKEIGGYGLNDISPIVADQSGHDDSHHRTHGLSAGVIGFSQLFTRMTELDPKAALKEFEAWPDNEDTVFARLRIWVAGESSLISNKRFGSIISGLSDRAFWDDRHQRDLLLVLGRRWNDLPLSTRRVVERKILEGPRKWRDEEDAHFEERKAWMTLNRVQWLLNQRCVLTSKTKSMIKILRASAPNWRVEYAEHAAGSLEARAGWVRKRTDFSELLDEPLNTVLSRAHELSGRSQDFLTEDDPYAGLSAEYPVRAFSALASAARRHEYPAWAWRKFLDSQARRNDEPRFVELIARRLVKYPDEAIVDFIHSASNWVEDVSKILAAQCSVPFDDIISKLIGVLGLHPECGRSSLVRDRRGPDWTTEAINAPAGRVAQALFNDPRKDDLKKGRGFPTSWLKHVCDLLALAGDMRLHSAVIFCQQLNWFYAVDPDWTDKNLVSLFESGAAQEQDAAWSGFLWSSTVPSPQLYMRLKLHLLAFIRSRGRLRRSYDEVLAGIILAGWGSKNHASGESFISNAEMRDLLLNSDGEFRCCVLWQIERWSAIEDDSDGEASEKWSGLVLTFLQEVWPRQLSARSSKVSMRLCELAFANEKQFPQLVALAVPLLTKIEGSYLRLPNLRKTKGNLVAVYPKETLALLDAVLPDDTSVWPYGIEAILQQIGEADPNLNSDERLIGLRRKWNAR